MMFIQQFEQMKRVKSDTPKKGNKKRKSDNQIIVLSEHEEEEQNFVRFQTQKTSQSLSVGQLRSKACPWMTKKTADIRNPLLRFHNEAVQFYSYIASTPQQRLMRKQAYNQIKQIVQKLIPGCELMMFGSSALGLELPDGDIDLTILVERDELEVLRIVYDEIRHKKDFIKLDFRRGKVPIINFHSTKYDLQFDISVNKRDGIKQLLQIQRMINTVPQFKYIFMILKCFLKIRGYSQTYHGYIGSYLLFCMVHQFLYEKYDGFKNFNSKVLLSQDVMSFMEFYAKTQWNQLEVMIGRGIIRERRGDYGNRPSYLRFMSPENPLDDVGGKAFKIREIFSCFKNRLQILKHKNFRRGESVLKELLNPSMQQFSYPNRQSQ